MRKEFENFRKSIIGLYEYKPIPKKLYHPLLFVVDFLLLSGLWLLFFRQREWLGLSVMFIASVLAFVIITRTRR